MKVAIDIDGVVSDMYWREPLMVEEGMDAFFSKGIEDKPIMPGVELVKSLMMAGHDIVWITGRPEKYKEDTLKWLANNIYDGKPEKVHRLVMRENAELLNNIYAKVKYYKREKPDLVIEDFTDITELLNQCGIMTMIVRYCPDRKADS